MISSSKFPVLVAVAAFVVLAATWFFLPQLQSAPAKVARDGIVHVERARRMLDRYNADVAYRALVRQQLNDADITLDPQSAGEIADGLGDDYRAAHTALWASFEPKDWQDGTGRVAKPSYGNLSTQIRDGLTARSNLAKENAALLDEALAEIDAALQIGSDYAEALRLKGVALYHRGMAELVAARVKRDAVEPLLAELAGLANEAEQIKLLQGILGESQIDDQINKTRSELQNAEARVTQARAEQETINTRIRDLEGRLITAQERMKAARAARDQILAAGVDFSDPNGGANFAKRLADEDVVYRNSAREVQEIEAGSLPHAEIDVTGDFLRGRYLENGSKELTVEPGLSHYRGELETASARLEREQAGVDSIRENLARLEAARKPLESQQLLASQRLPQIESQAAEAYSDLSRINSEGQAIEEKALKFLDQSVGASQQAAGQADKWAADGRESVANFGPESKDRSAGNARSDDGWLGGFINAQVADAKAAKAWIYYERMLAARRMTDVFERITNQVAVREVDINAERTKADAAKDAAVKEIEQAMAALEKAHRSADKHWTLAAQAAGVNYLMVLLGHDEYLADTIEAYRNAVKGRESEPAVEQFVSRLRSLEARQP